MTAQFDMIMQFATLATLLAGVVFGLLELRRARRGRAEKAAIDVFSVVLQEVFNDAHILILNLPLDVSPDHIRSSPNLRRSAELLMSLYEYWGMMVFYRIVPLRTLDLLVGGTVRGSWSRLHKYIASERDALSIAAFGEWFQWLAERMKDREKSRSPVPAYIAHKEWDG